MAPLKHVCMWSDNGWNRITIEEATRLHPEGTVSAHSELFMCELCGQFVILTKENTRKRYFKHSKYEESKDCPDRASGAGGQITYKAQEHDLPIRIKDILPSSFSFELGMIRAPISSLGKNFRLHIQPKDESVNPFVFTKERLNEDCITYLSIGERPYERYTLSFQNGNDDLKAFWPSEIKGIDPKGTLFEESSGKKLPYDADVVIEKNYYLLKCGNLYSESVTIKEVAKKSFSRQTWRLYLVLASVRNEKTAKFFLDFHCRLTEQPVSLKPVWPLFVEGRYVFKHNQSNVWMLVGGDAPVVRTFPNVTTRQLLHNPDKLKLYNVICAERQQLISIGRTHALQYIYFWKEPLSQEGAAPQVAVTDLTGAEIPPGEANALPQDKIIRIKLSYDGEIIQSNNRRIVEKRKVSANTLVELDHLEYGIHIQIIIGLDCVWEKIYKKKQAYIVNNERVLLERITNTSGASIPAPHSLGSILIGMRYYPLICQWIRRCIKDGTINEQSYRRLQEAYRNIKTNRRGDL